MSRRKGPFFVIAGLLLGCLLHGAVLEQGMSPEEVETALGEPNGSRELADGRIWVYSGGISLRFVEGALAEASGVDMVVPDDPESAEEEPPSAEEPPDEPEEKVDPSAESPPQREKEAPAAPVEAEESLDEEIETMEKVAADPTSVLAEEGEEEKSVSGDGGILSRELLVAVLLTLVQFAILWIACRVTGIEAYAVSLFFIAVMDRLVIHWMQWVFLSFLAFPTTFHADSFVSFLVMLVMFMKFTSAKSLPSALKVVVVSKVIGIVIAYALVMFVLFNL